MRAVIQRVKEAKVECEGAIVGEISRGFLVLLGVAEGDAEEDFQYLLRKISALRVFSDLEGKMNLALTDVGGSVLLVSQFTLLAETEKGNRPSFLSAAKPDVAEKTYLRFGAELAKMGVPVSWGKFGADMQVFLCNDGPVTILLDSKRK